MDALSKLTVSLYICKRAEENIQHGQPAAVKKWDNILGVPQACPNMNVTDPEQPHEGLAKDVYSNNKQLISGTGAGSLISGKYSNS